MFQLDVSILLVYDTISIAKLLLTSWKPKTLWTLKMGTARSSDTSVTIYADIASYPRCLESSSTPLQEPQISHVKLINKLGGIIYYHIATVR